MKRTKIFDLFGSAVIATMLAASLTMLSCVALGLFVELRPVLLLCASLSLLLATASHSKRGALLALLLLVGAFMLLSINGINPANQLGALARDVIKTMSTGELTLVDHTFTLAMALSVVMTLMLFWMTRMSGGVYPALTLAVIILLGCWFIERRIEGMYLVPVIAGLAAMFARAPDNRIQYMRALPVGLIVALLAFNLTPAGEVSWPPLRDGAERIRQLFFDYFMFNDSRTAYSLHGDGYLPLADRLGGPADPTEGDVMRVKSDRVLYLRGSIKRTYTGYSWTDNAVNYRYLFGDITKRSTRDGVFDVGRAAGLQNGGAFSDARAEITFLGDYTSTLFVPHRISNLSAALDLVTYYNTGGEVFITRPVTLGDQYSLTAEIPTGDENALKALVEEAAARVDPQYAEILSQYTTLPRGVEDGVYWLTQSVIEGAQSPYEKAVRIRDYLLTQFEYTLDVPYPPLNRDFVSYFLLTEKKGYCTYFSTAMAVMARMAELPTRYVEGYVVPPGSDGERIVTGQNAHAWVEVYFNGIGWLTFNPTPGFGDMNAENQGMPDQPTESPSGEEQPPDEDEQSLDENDGEGEDTLDEEPTPPPSEQQETPPPDEGEQPPEPTIPPEDQPEDTPEESPPSRQWIWWVLLTLLVLALLGFCFARVRLTNPVYLTSITKDGTDKLMIWYRALLKLLKQQGMSPEPNETPVMFANRLAAAGTVDVAFVTFAAQIARARYGNGVPEGSAYKQASSAYEVLRKQIKPIEKARWYADRILHGLGDIKSVP